MTTELLDTNQPLSIQQEQLWLFDQLRQGSEAYHICRGYRLDGRLDLPALRRALSYLVDLHQTLRTNIAARRGRPAVVVTPVGAQVALPVTDVRPDDRAGQREVARAFMAEPYDLAEGLLLRARVVRLGPARHILLLGVHHIAADDWSVRILVSQLATLYSAFVAGLPSPLCAPASTYAEFVEWQRGVLREEVERYGDAVFWRSTLDGARPVPLPPRSGPEPTASAGATHRFVLPPPVVADLRELARRERATLFVTGLTAFALALAAWTGAHDLVVGTPFAARTLPGSESVVGMFVNVLALRLDLTGVRTRREALSRVRRSTFDAFNHPLLPYEWLGEVLGSRPVQLVQVAFQVLEQPLGVDGIVGWAGLTATPWDDFGDAATRLPLELHLVPGAPGEGVTGYLSHDPAAVSPAQAEEFTAAYVAQLRALVTCPDLPLEVGDAGATRW